MPKYYEPDVLRRFFSDARNGWGAQTWSVQAGFNQLIKTLLMPDVTDYGPETAYDGSVLYNEWPYSSGAAVDLTVTDARYYSTRWSRGRSGQRDCGYYWWDCLHHVGFYLDKIMAIYALSDSETNYVARATPEDIREWQIGFFSTFSDQIMKLNNAIMGQDWSTIAPYLENGQLTWPNYTSDLTEVHSRPINPYATFTIQLYWQVLGLARFQNSYDQRFLEENQIWIEGAGAAPQIADTDKVTWIDPVSGTVYAARLGFEDAPYGGQILIEKAMDLELYSTFCVEDCLDPQGDLSREAVTVQLRKVSQLINALSTVQRRMRFGNPFAP
jgi:hypothetical protein